MRELPQVIAENYRPATVREVRGRSFGAVTAPRNPLAASWQQRRGTLADQAIFGPCGTWHALAASIRGTPTRISSATFAV